jgi:hypothetical protein
MKILHPFIWLALSAPVLALACSSGSDDVGSGENAIGGSQGKPAASPGAGSTNANSFATSNGFEVIFLGSQTNADGTSTWRYRVNETPCAQDLSNWVLEIFDCSVVSASPEPNEFVHPDPNAKLTGVKWETGGGFASGEFAVTVSGPARAETIRFAVKGPDVVLGETTGPRCGDAAAPPVAPPTGTRGKDRCPDASVPRSDAAPPPPPPPPPPAVDAGADGATCTMTCSEEVPCPSRFYCDVQGCCQFEIR